MKNQLVPIDILPRQLYRQHNAEKKHANDAFKFKSIGNLFSFRNKRTSRMNNRRLGKLAETAAAYGRLASAYLNYSPANVYRSACARATQLLNVAFQSTIHVSFANRVQSII